MMSDKIIKIEASGGVVVRVAEDEEEVLLIFRNGIWDLPKGKREEGESSGECAIREVSEETGIGEIALTDFIGVTYHTYSQNDLTIGKETCWYRMETAGGDSLKPQGEEGITQVKWTKLEEALSIVGFQNLKDILNKVRSGVA